MSKEINYNYDEYINSIVAKAAKYDEIKTKIKNIQDTIESYQFNKDSIFEDERCFVQSLLEETIEDIKSIDLED